MRLMLDTCVIIDLLVDVDNLTKGALDLLGDPDNVLFASAESMRMALMSSDLKFPFYRNQGLELIEY